MNMSIGSSGLAAFEDYDANRGVVMLNIAAIQTRKTKKKRVS